MENNLKTYSRSEVINRYHRAQGLQKPEQTILETLKNYLGQMKMLDIGVGGGRTTTYFAPLVKEYIGVDYVEEMVLICKNKFQLKFPDALFKVADVRNLNEFADHGFDFIFFSFNGIDYIKDEERKKAIEQIRNALKPNGYFGFSSHNIQYINNLYNTNLAKFRFQWNLFALFKQTMLDAKIKKLNQAEIARAKTADHIIINDGALNFGLQTYYIRPFSQIKILAELGFKNTRCFSLETGQEISSDAIANCNDCWIYYLCQRI